MSGIPAGLIDLAALGLPKRGPLAVFHGPRCLARYRADGEPIDTPTRQAA